MVACTHRYQRQRDACPHLTTGDGERCLWHNHRVRKDADYIAARMAYRAQLPVQFLWASQQALEKYLKCMLFIRRIPAAAVKHDLRRALALVHSSAIPLALTERSRKFIQEIDDVGQYRYLEASFFE